MNRLRILAVLMVASLLQSCLFENDLSYPVIPADIVSFKVEGQTSVVIDQENHEVIVEFGETVDLTRVKVLDVTVSEDAHIVGDLPSYLDFTEPFTLVVKTYKETVWKFSGTQPILRYIDVENQIGEAEFDVQNKTAVVYVSDKQPLKTITFNAMKLEKEGSTVISTTGTVNVDKQPVEETLPCEFPMTLECVLLRKFTVQAEEGTVDWIVRVLTKEVSAEVTSVNPWATHAYVTALFDGNGEPYLEYSTAGADTWTRVSDMTIAGTGISAEISGLEAETSYEVRLVNGDSVSAPLQFETEAELQVPNMNFDDWYASDPSAAKAIWYPYSSAEEQAWDSANPGAATFIGSSTVPEDNFVISGRAARLESKYAVIAFAAGNIYTGKFGKIAGVGAELDWGYGFTSRPTSLKGHYCYEPKLIDQADKSMKDHLGTMDKCQIQVILADWDAPFPINTTKGNFVDIDNDPHIIAFGRLESDESTGGNYREFTIDLEYRSMTRKPKYVVISACASSLGDYFTGGVGSVLYVDEFKFDYKN